MNIDDLKPNAILKGDMFQEPVQVLSVAPFGSKFKVGVITIKSSKYDNIILTVEELEKLEVTPDKESFDGNSHHFRLGVEALRLGLAYEYDPYFALAIARVDPLPHQLEAVYDYFLKQPRIRFLLADDPGAGKTIMAGLLLKELKVRGLVKRTLIITPANLTFQWQRELKDKFREDFEIVKGDVLRGSYGSNPWQEKNQVVTSIAWVSRIEEAKKSLLKSNWDLIIVDEAHKMSAYRSDKKTLAYKLGEELSQITDHYLLMTATPHKGDVKNFCLFLELLDKDVYGDVKSLQEAMAKNHAPFYLRRNKEALRTFPDPETGMVKKLFTNRKVETIAFEIDAAELKFYEALTEYVEDQSIKASADGSRGQVLGFTMAMLQRRFASSICAVRRSLERMRDNRQKVLDNPKAHLPEQIDEKLLDNFDELNEAEQQNYTTKFEKVVASVNPGDLRREINQINRLIGQAKHLEKTEVESKLVQLKKCLTDEKIFADPRVKLLIFTEHKDTLYYLVGKLKEWGLSVTKIHGGMKNGDPDTSDTRICAEREFKETCQVLVATEAAGEGINLQFCWLMINYDIPWNPIRLEQRMGRIHRYGQEKDCLIFNFVAINTREGKVLSKLFERIRTIEMDLDPEKTGKIFNVLGDIFPANKLEKMIRDMYTHNLTEAQIIKSIVEQVDVEYFRNITNSTLEGLAKSSLNLSQIIGKNAEAKERRLIPEVIEDFFIQAAPLVGIYPKETAKGKKIYKIGNVPQTLWKTGDNLEPKFGKLLQKYEKITFNKNVLINDPTPEWVTPGHPLFECVREAVFTKVESDLKRGAIFLDINRFSPARLDVFSATIGDGLGRQLHERLYVVETELDGKITVRQPTIFLDLVPGENADLSGIDLPDDSSFPTRDQAELALDQDELNNFLTEIKTQRQKEVNTIKNHVNITFDVIIDKEQSKFIELDNLKESGSKEIGLDGRINQSESRLLDLNNRWDKRIEELNKEGNCSIKNIRHFGSAWVIPHPDRNSPENTKLLRDVEIEKIAINAVIEYEKSRGYLAVSVETENRGFDLISRPLDSELSDAKAAGAVRFIEVKGRATMGDLGLTTNEYKTAERLKDDYWLYAVFNCASSPQIYPIQNPVKLGCEPLVKIEHYYIDADKILGCQTQGN